MGRRCLVAAVAVAAGLAAAAPAFTGGQAGPQAPAGEWRAYGADAASTKYSPLDRIHKGNVSRLSIAWRRRAVDPALRQAVRGVTASNYYRVTPLMVGGRLYVQNGLGFAEALDPVTGRTIWTQKPLVPGLEGLVGAAVSRGVGYWQAGADERILTVRRNYLFALDARTGAPVAGFGDDGKVDLSTGSGPEGFITWGGAPLIVSDTVVVGSILSDYPTKKEGVPGHVRGFDMRTGRLRWTFRVVPRPGEFGVETWENESWAYTGAANMWSSPSADLELGYVYVPLSSPTNDWYGGHRLGDNLFSDTLVCLDAATGRRVWHFQLVHHDLWDYDLPAAPILADITVDGRPIKAVVQLTKQGFAFVFDRVTGRPVWPIEERPVPPSTVPGERASPTQPFPVRPPPFARQGLSVDDLIDFTPELRREAMAIADQYLLGPLYTPPPVAGVPPAGKKGLLQMPGWVGGADWNGGAFDPETGVLYVPSINAPVISTLMEGDPKTTNFRYLNTLPPAERIIHGPRGLPLIKPPYGTIAALDLGQGTLLWNVPNGDGPRHHPLLKELKLPPLGQPGRPGPLLTRTLLFVGEGDPVAVANPPGGGGTAFRAYDKATGAVVWTMDLAAGTTGTPMTYLAGGRQYIVVPIGSATHQAELVALAVVE
jgi:quinoprotein glucose dehydrogenase